MLHRLGFPSVGRHRRFVTAIAIDAVGSGVFMPICMLYFLVATDLSLVQVGAAISLASLVALPAGPLIGSVVDRIGAKQVLLAGNALQGAGFVAYLFSDSFLAVTAWTVVVAVGRTAFWGSYGNIVAAISVPGEREKWFGFLGALRNVGFAIGGLVSGLAITIGTQTAYAAVVVANAVSYAVAFVLLLAVPATERSEHRAQPGSWATVLRDGPYRVLWFAQFAFSMSMMVLNFAMPVYATTVLGLPGWVTGAVFTINTIMVGLGQGLAVRAMTGRVRWRILVLANLFFAASYVVLLGATAVGDHRGRGRVLVGSVIYTLGRADRRSGDLGARRGGGARPPAGSVPLDDPAGLEPVRHDRPGDVRLAARPGRDTALVRGARPDPGRRGGLGAARAGAAAGRPAGHECRRRPRRRVHRGRAGRGRALTLGSCAT